MSEPLAIDAQKLTRRLGASWALRGVDFQVPVGRLVLLFGANGAGKTTLVRVLGTALRPTTGSLKLFGTEARGPVRPRVGLLSHADGHYDELSARENLTIAHALGADRRSVADVLGEVGLANRADDLVRTFSAGMRKRLAFARLLLKDPELLLLDEPYAQLDPPGHLYVDEFLRGLRARNRTVVVSTHMVARVATLCHCAVRLSAGRISWEGPAVEAPAFASGPEA